MNQSDAFEVRIELEDLLPDVVTSTVEYNGKLYITAKNTEGKTYVYDASELQTWLGRNDDNLNPVDDEVADVVLLQTGRTLRSFGS